MKNKSYKLKLKSINKHELSSYDACYLLNSVSFITGIKQIDFSYYKLNEKIQNEFKDYISNNGDEYGKWKKSTNGQVSALPEKI